MFSHMMVGSNDIGKSKTFYDAVFTAVGGKPGITDPKGRLVYLHNGGVFLVTPPIDGKPATHGNGMTIGFAMKSTAEADTWHKAGAAAVFGPGTVISEAAAKLLRQLADRLGISLAE